MSTWYHVENKSIAKGTKFPCKLPDGCDEAVQDEERFLERLKRYPGVTQNGPDWAETWMFEKDGEHAGEMSLLRAPAPGPGFNPFQMLAETGSRQEAIEKVLESIEKARKRERKQPLLGFSVHMDPLDLLPLYRHMKRAFPGLVITKDESTFYYDADAWEAWAKSWLEGGAYNEEGDDL